MSEKSVNELIDLLEKKFNVIRAIIISARACLKNTLDFTQQLLVSGLDSELYKIYVQNM